MSLRRSPALLALLLSSAAHVHAAPPKSPPPKAPGKAEAPLRPVRAAGRQPARRTVVVSDATRDVEIHVAANTVVTLTFPVPVAGVMLPDTRGFFEAPTWDGRLVFVFPRTDVPQGDAVIMTVALQDGTLLPPFILVTRSGEADVAIDIDVQLEKKASSESATSLRLQISELQAKLDSCNEQAKGVGSIKVGELVLAQDATKPTAFVVERHDARILDKQSRLLVETRVIYRLFDLSYLLVTIENRDPDKTWILDSAEVSVEGGGNASETRVVHLVREFERLAPGVEGRVVVVFQTPSQNTSQLFTLKLLENGGPRHVELKGLKL